MAWCGVVWWGVIQFGVVTFDLVSCRLQHFSLVRYYINKQNFPKKLSSTSTFIPPNHHEIFHSYKYPTPINQTNPTAINQTIPVPINQTTPTSTNQTIPAPTNQTNPTRTFIHSLSPFGQFDAIVVACGGKGSEDVSGCLQVTRQQHVMHANIVELLQDHRVEHFQTLPEKISITSFWP